jgi:hypothetical protein
VQASTASYRDSLTFCNLGEKKVRSIKGRERERENIENQWQYGRKDKEKG